MVDIVVFLVYKIDSEILSERWQIACILAEKPTKLSFIEGKLVTGQALSISASFLDILVRNEVSYFFEIRGVPQIPPKNS